MIYLILKHNNEKREMEVFTYTRADLANCPYYSIRCLFYALEIDEWTVCVQNFDPLETEDGIVPMALHDSNYSLDLIVGDKDEGAYLERLNYARVRLRGGSLHYVGWSLIKQKSVKIPMRKVLLANENNLPADVFVRYAQLRGIIAYQGWPATKEMMDKYKLIRVTKRSSLKNVVSQDRYNLVMCTEDDIEAYKKMGDVDVLDLLPSEVTFNISPQTTNEAMLVLEEKGMLTISTVAEPVDLPALLRLEHTVGIHGIGVEEKLRTFQNLINTGLSFDEVSSIKWN